jgi:thioester reductase-like protein
MKRAAKVLLTGASGFLGIHLLHDLLARDDAAVSCLLRGASEAQVREALEQKWRWFFPEVDIGQYRDRLHIVFGEVTAPRFGLGLRAYDALAETHGQMFNVAANVSAGGRLEDMLRVNVGVVASLIELAKYGAPKQLHHVSTVSITGYFTSQPSIGAFSEQHLTQGQTFGDAYGESKYRAEVLLREAFAQGIRGAAYRVGYIGPHSQTGRFQQNPDQNYTSRYLRACVHLGFAAYLPKTQIPLTPVDSVSGAILTLAKASASDGQTYYVETPHPLAHYDIIRVLQAAGYPIRLMSMEHLMAKAQSLSNDEEALKLVLPQGEEPYPVPIDSSFSQATLGRLGFEYPRPSSEWLGRFIQHAIDVGFLEPPRFWNAAPPLAELI